MNNPIKSASVDRPFRGSLWSACLLVLTLGVLPLTAPAKQQLQSDATATNLVATHRSGQTFLTWQEPDNTTQYHVYRHIAPITAENVASASKLTRRWGPLDADTSVNIHGVADAPNHFVIADLQEPLADDVGLFVYTTRIDETGPAYYAVVSVVNGVEVLSLGSGDNSLYLPVNESVALPAPVLTRSENNGKGRLYTQYMDYANWNPSFNGYAYNYSVALPYNYNPETPYSLAVILHAYGEEMRFHKETEYRFPVIQLFLSDPGASQQAKHSWWYGYSADHNYKTAGTTPTAGYIANFTEQRIMKAIDEVQSNPDFNVDPELVYAYGNSMGASGVLSLGLRYSSVFAGAYANQPMTNYLSSPTFKENFAMLWGEPKDNLPIVNSGLHSDEITKYDARGTHPTGVWNWMNHHKQVVRRRGDSFAYLMLAHGKSDKTIDWHTQGQPVIKALTAANAGFSAASIASAGHSWLGFVAVNTELFGFGYDEKFPWRYPRSRSFPAIQNASGSGAINPTTQGDESYNLNIEWATEQIPFGKQIMDKRSRYEVSLRSTDEAQLADITPRNTQQFKPSAGQQCSWRTVNTRTRRQLANGEVTVDSDALVTVERVEVLPGSGTRLYIECPGA